jgi:hypothetical protein
MNQLGTWSAPGIRGGTIDQVAAKTFKRLAIE